MLTIIEHNLDWHPDFVNWSIVERLDLISQDLGRVDLERIPISYSIRHSFLLVFYIGNVLLPRTACKLLLVKKSKGKHRLAYIHCLEWP